MNAYRGFLLGIILVAITVWMAETAPSASPPLQPPSLDHFMGTDRFGRDVMAVTVRGAVYTLKACVLALILSVGLGLLNGIVSVAHFGDLSDQLFVISADAIRSFPSIVLALSFVISGVPVWVVLVVYFWVPIWRITRISLAAQRRQPYVLAAQLFGRSRYSALAREAFPNVWYSIRPYVILVFAEVVSVQAGLEFLGFGPPLNQPSFGNIVSESLRLGGRFYWVWLPGIVFVLGIFLFLLFIAVSWSQHSQPMYLE